jgi:large conductance mechanosensitive channel
MLIGFVDFVRKQGVVGLGVGLVLGGAVSKLVTSLVNDIIQPILGTVLGFTGSLKEAYLMIGSARVMWGNFVGALIDFLIIAFVVYVVVEKSYLGKGLSDGGSAARAKSKRNL